MQVGNLKGPLMMPCVPQPIVAFNKLRPRHRLVSTYNVNTPTEYVLLTISPTTAYVGVGMVNWGAKRKPSDFMAVTDLSAGSNKFLLFH